MRAQLLVSLLALTPGVALRAAAQPPGADSRAAPAAAIAPRTLDARALLMEFTRAARLPGSEHEREVADLCRRALEAAGLAVTIEARPLEVRLPTRQDLQVFAASGEALAVLERFEVFDWDALPTWPIPPVYAEAAAGDVRGEVVDAGAGAASDYARLVEQRIEVRGAVVLVRSTAAPAELAREAERHGARALLVHVPRRTGDSAWPVGPWANARQLAADEVHAGCTIPVAPIRASEVAAISARLRARRVRGADGQAITVQVGPGPVEVRLALEVPVHVTQALVLTARTPGADDAAPRLRAPLATLSEDALAAAETVAALWIAARAGGPATGGAQGLCVVLGSTATNEASVLGEVPAALGRSADVGRELGALLGYATDLTGTHADGFTLVDRFLDPDLARMRAVTDSCARWLRERAASPAPSADALRAHFGRLPWFAERPAAPKAEGQ